MWEGENTGRPMVDTGCLVKMRFYRLLSVPSLTPVVTGRSLLCVRAEATLRGKLCHLDRGNLCPAFRQMGASRVLFPSLLCLRYCPLKRICISKWHVWGGILASPSYPSRWEKEEASVRSCVGRGIWLVVGGRENICNGK